MYDTYPDRVEGLLHHVVHHVSLVDDHVSLVDDLKFIEGYDLLRVYISTRV
jgi:hypothetical protein